MFAPIHRLGLLIVVPAALVGCPDGPPDQGRPQTTPSASAASSTQGGPASSASASAARCADDTAALSKWIEALAAEGVLVRAPAKELRPVSVEERATPIQRGPHVEVGPAQVLYDGQVASKTSALSAITPPAELVAMMKKTLAAHAESAPGTEAPPLLVDVDRDVTWSAVVSIFRAAAAAGLDRATFLFQAKSAVSAPPPSSIDGQLAGDVPMLGPYPPIGPGLSGRVYANCQTASFWLAKVAGAADKKVEVLTSGLADAIRKCDCNVQMNEARTLLWHWFERTEGAPRFGAAISIAKPADKLATEVASRAATPWSEAAAPLRAAALQAKPVRLVVK